MYSVMGPFCKCIIYIIIFCPLPGILAVPLHIKASSRQPQTKTATSAEDDDDDDDWEDIIDNDGTTRIF